MNRQTRCAVWERLQQTEKVNEDAMKRKLQWWNSLLWDWPSTKPYFNCKNEICTFNAENVVKFQNEKKRNVWCTAVQPKLCKICHVRMPSFQFRWTHFPYMCCLFTIKSILMGPGVCPSKLFNHLGGSPLNYTFTDIYSSLKVYVNYLVQVEKSWDSKISGWGGRISITSCS